MPSIGIVDLGSNNARMVVFEYEPARWFRLVDVIREPVRLGEGLGASGAMTREAIERGVAALDLFSDYAAASGLDQLKTIGTSALRDASNRQLFARAVDHLGFEVEVLSGAEEARRGVLAVANGFAFEDAWVMDLGGGSAQISRMENRKAVVGTAYPLGGVRLTEAFFTSVPPRRSEVRALEAWVAELLSASARRMRKERLPLIAMGGTIRNLARMMQKRRGYPLDVLHGYFLRRSELEEAVKVLLVATPRERARLSGINADRADVILAGALVYRFLLRATGYDGIWISGHGLREGTFYRSFLKPPYRLRHVRTFSISNLAARYGLEAPHHGHVRRLASQIFHGLAPLHGLGKEEAELLDAAALLHDIGIAVDFYRHHRHGAYVLGSDALPGFTHREQALLQLLVRYHHGGTPRFEGYEVLMRAGDKRLLARLAACLRLAESLERSQAGRIKRVRVELGTDAALLRLTAEEEPAVEIWETTKHGALFQQAFGKRLVLSTANGRGPAQPAAR